MDTPTQVEELDVKEYIQALQVRMLRQSIGHMPDAIDPRTGLIGIKNGLFARPGKNSFPDDVLGVLEDERHERRWPGIQGPLFVFWDGHKTRSYVGLETILLHPEKRVRTAALNELARQSKTIERFLSPDTESRLNELGEVIIADNTPEALSSTVEIADRLNDDYFYHLEGVRQCAQLKIFDELPHFLFRVLAPNERTLQFLMQLPVWSPNRQGKAIEQMLTGIVEAAATIDELLDEYFRLFGHLPLAGQNSAGAVVGAWKSGHELQGDPWRQVWDWADKNRSPLARYHACQLLCHNSDWVADGRRLEFANECRQLVDGTSTFTGWKRRCDLARHYIRHMESLCPGADGGRIAAFAWWLTEYLQSVLDSFEAESRDRCDTAIEEACRISDEVWTIVRPSVSRSSLRYATHFSANLWATALLAELACSELSSVFDQNSPPRDSLALALSKPSFVGLGREGRSSIDFAFESCTVPLMRQVAELDIDQSLATLLRSNAKVLAGIREEGQLNEFIKGLPTMECHVANLVAHELRLSSFEGTTPLDAAWELFLDDDWRKQVLVDGSDQAVEMILSAAIELQLSDSTHDWASYLPHILALVTEEASECDTRRRLLFAYAVTTSLAVDSVSAIQRLLTSPTRRDFEDFVAKWRERIELATPISPAWVAARLRGVKCVLHI